MTQLHQVASNLYVTESRLDDFDVRGVVVIGSERTVVWDTLSHPSDMRPLLPLLRDRKASVVYSHADWDHIWGTAAIPYHEVIAHRLCQERFSTDVPRCLADKRLQEPEKWDEVV
jgi:glyoxylase-like metal-dependent hydrolase (beta-lactamase superfamily II)